VAVIGGTIILLARDATEDLCTKAWKLSEISSMGGSPGPIKAATPVVNCSTAVFNRLEVMLLELSDAAFSTKEEIVDVINDIVDDDEDVRKPELAKDVTTDNALLQAATLSGDVISSGLKEEASEPAKDCRDEEDAPCTSYMDVIPSHSDFRTLSLTTAAGGFSEQSLPL